MTRIWLWKRNNIYNISYEDILRNYVVFKCRIELTFHLNIVIRPLIIILNCTTWLPHPRVFLTNKLHIVQVPSLEPIVRNKNLSEQKKYNTVAIFTKSNRTIVETSIHITHVYMTAHFPRLIQSTQKHQYKVAGLS